MSEPPDAHAVPGGVWRRVGMLVLVSVTAAALVALGLVLTGIIAEPETLIVNIGRFLFHR